MLKQFVEEQHAIHDAEAKEAVQQFWVKLGYNCIENPDEFGIDLLVKGKGCEFGSEVETKTAGMGLSLNLPPCIFRSANKSSQTIVSPFFAEQ